MVPSFKQSCGHGKHCNHNVDNSCTNNHYGSEQHAVTFHDRCRRKQFGINHVPAKFCNHHYTNRAESYFVRARDNGSCH